MLRFSWFLAICVLPVSFLWASDSLGLKPMKKMAKLQGMRQADWSRYQELANMRGQTPLPGNPNPAAAIPDPTKGPAPAPAPGPAADPASNPVAAPAPAPAVPPSPPPSAPAAPGTPPPPAANTNPAQAPAASNPPPASQAPDRPAPYIFVPPTVRRESLDGGVNRTTSQYQNGTTVRSDTYNPPDGFGVGSWRETTTTASDGRTTTTRTEYPGKGKMVVTTTGPDGVPVVKIYRSVPGCSYPR
jgi:hypothetical protein